MAIVGLKFFKRNLFACLQEVTSSLRLFEVASSGLQMMKYFSHRHKLQRFETGLKGGVCFKIFQVISNFNFASFKCQTCLLSSVLSFLLGSFKEDLWLANLILNEVFREPHISLVWLAVFRCHCCLVNRQTKLMWGSRRPRLKRDLPIRDSFFFFLPSRHYYYKQTSLCILLELMFSSYV